MLFKKDKFSRFSFISVSDFILALVLMFISTVFSFVLFPFSLKKVLGQYSGLIDSHYFGIFVFFLSSFFTLYIIYYICCKKRQKPLKEGLFLYMPKTSLGFCPSIPFSGSDLLASLRRRSGLDKPGKSYSSKYNIFLLYLWSNKTIVISFLTGIIMPLITLPVIFKFAPKEFYAMDLLKKQSGLIYLFTCAITAPIFEEVFYRGFIFPFFQSKLNSFWAVIITSVFFGFSHFINIGNAHILLSLFIFYGFVLTLIRYFTNSLIPPIITHFVHNLVLISVFFIMSILRV